MIVIIVISPNHEKEKRFDGNIRQKGRRNVTCGLNKLNYVLNIGPPISSVSTLLRTDHFL